MLVVEFRESTAPQMTKARPHTPQEPPSQKVASALRDQWLNENAAAFAAQAAWHEKHGHPLTEIISGPLNPL